MKTKNKKKFFTKKVTLLFILGLTFLFWVSFFVTLDENVSASVLKLSQVARNRKALFSSKKTKNTIPTVCIDSDNGINYTTKGIITLSGGTHRIEKDTCNPDGTLREWFCWQPGDPAGLLRSENHIHCAYWCSDWACNVAPTTWNISIKDLAIEHGYFIASNNHNAIFSITVKNIGNTNLPIDGFWHELFLDWISTNITDNYSLEMITEPNLGILEPNNSYVISANIRLNNERSFSYYDTLHVDISTYPETDYNMSNNSILLYITGDIVDCTTPENVLNCSLWLSDCPLGCSWYFSTWIGDAIIENIYFTPNTNPFMGSNNDDNQINIVIKNIGNGPLVVPQELWTKKFLLGCSYIWWNGWFRTAIIPEHIINPGEHITTTIDVWFTDDIYNRYNPIWNRYLKCTLTSQQEQWRSNTDPNNLSIVYESNGDNNSFTLNYMVVDSIEVETWDTKEIIQEKMITK